MRTQAALALLAASMLCLSGASAQPAPSADQIVKSLTPSSTSGSTRGIRLAPSGASPTAPGPSQQAAVSGPSVSLNVQFASGSAELTPQAMLALDQLGQALSNQSLATYRFRIEGHTDTVGTREHNKALSDQRAAAVVDYLANKFHIDRSRVQAVGMGEDGLAVATPDQTPEPRNRRVQVVNIGS
jgi:outer membrane protein OmpA-like peptidoglycan-associated protein